MAKASIQGPLPLLYTGKPKLHNMTKSVIVSMAAMTAFALASCSNQVENPLPGNPLTAQWEAYYQIPPFGEIRNEHYIPAIEYAAAQAREEIDAIVNNTEAPTFENTIVAYDNSGELFDRVYTILSSEGSINASDEINEIARNASKISSELANEISLNPALFERIKAVHDSADTASLRPDQKRLLKLTYDRFVRNGALLDDSLKNILKEINLKISANQLRFSQNMTKETAAYKLIIENEADLAGLTEAQIADAASRAEKAGDAGKWYFGLDNPSIMPFLANAQNRELRKQILTAYLNRCNNGNEEDNNEIIRELLKLRLEKAKLLGYNSCAEYILQDRMAKTPEAVYELLDQIWKPAIAKANEELAQIKEYMKKDGISGEPQAWDWRYYAQKVMVEKYSLDESQMAPYFHVDSVMKGIFYVAGRLYGMQFEKLENVPMPHQECKAFKVTNKDGGEQGVIFFDLFARPGQKRGGAWCGTYRGESYTTGERVGPIVTIVANFSRPVGDNPSLLTTDEVETLFHEFGHGIDNLMKDVKYAGLRGYPRDFVEIHSQIDEHWAFAPEVLAVYAKHWQTGEVIPQELVDKMDAAGKYGQGFATVEYLAASLLDMDYHCLTEIPENLDLEKFEEKSLGGRGILKQIPSRYKTSYFNHIWGGGYTAGYYSYIWAEVLDCDAFEAYVEAGDIFSQEVASRYANEILKRSNEDDAMNLYINFRGRKPGTDALLRKRGLE